ILIALKIINIFIQLLGTVENETTENLNTFVLTNVETHITEVPHSKLDAPKLSSRLYTSGKRNECWKEARCEPLEEHTCFGVNLPYTHTSLALSGLPSQRAAREALEYMTALKNLPHCWSVVQPFLCAILFPQKCVLLLEDHVDYSKKKMDGLNI
ncbi:hypothetical protein Anas_08720, partial [Armadillidium nasatum]